MGYYMESVQYNLIWLNIKLREDLVKITQVPFWKRFCSNMDNRTSVYNSVPTADILTLAQKLGMNFMNHLNGIGKRVCQYLTDLYEMSDEDPLNKFDKQGQAILDAQTDVLTDTDYRQCVGYSRDIKGPRDMVTNHVKGKTVCYSRNASESIIQSRKDPSTGTSVSDRILSVMKDSLSKHVFDRDLLQSLRGPDDLEQDRHDEYTRRLFMDTNANTFTRVSEIDSNGLNWTGLDVATLSKLTASMKRISIIQRIR